MGKDQEPRYIPLPTDRTIRERVRRGAKYLDDHLDPVVMGFRWREKMTDDLDMTNGAMCVLGQTFGSYTDGLIRLGELNGVQWTGDGATAPATYGFCVPFYDTYVNKDGREVNHLYWAKLELAWRRELGLDENKMTRDITTGHYRLRY